MTAHKQKEVGIDKQRKHTNDIQNTTYEVETMSKQAKTLTQQELRRVLDYTATRKHSVRNRALLMTTHLSGMRVGEVASLRNSDVLDAEGNIRNEIRLSAEQTKGNEARVVFVSDKLRKELELYIRSMNKATINPTLKFFYSQKSSSDGFTANTLTQFFHYLYKRAGVDGASSHSGRRTFITNLASKGVGVRVIMGLSGHKALSSVQCYIDCNSDLMRNAVELV